MKTEENKELGDFLVAVATLRNHLAADPQGTQLVDDALNKLCRYYNSDPVARGGR